MNDPSVQLGLCPCGAPGALFSPGRDTITGPGGILVMRGQPARATCIPCWNALAHPVAPRLRPIPGVPGYSADSDGNIVGRYQRPMATKLTPSGYPFVTVRVNGKKFCKPVHWFVCLAWHGAKPSALHEVAHRQPPKTNTRPDNLRWATKQENVDDSIKQNLMSHGEAHFFAKLREQDVREIRRLRASGVTLSSIGSMFGVAESTVHKIVYRKAWRHLDEGDTHMVERVRSATTAVSAGYNGPDKPKFNDGLAEYTEVRFQQMRWAAKASAFKARWERKGGAFEDIQYGFAQGKLTREERVAKISARARVDGWMGTVTVQDDGQTSFAVTFDQAAPDELGAGGAPLGSRLSLARAQAEGYNTGRHGGSLADCEFPAESEEAHIWAEGYGDGMRDRVEKEPKPPRANGEAKSATQVMAELAASMPVDSGRVKPERKMAAANDEAEPAVERPAKRGARQKAAEGNGAVD